MCIIVTSCLCFSGGERHSDVYTAAAAALPAPDVARLEQLQTSVEQMLALLLKQQAEIEQLRGDLSQARSTQVR